MTCQNDCEPGLLSSMADNFATAVQYLGGLYAIFFAHAGLTFTISSENGAVGESGTTPATGVTHARFSVTGDGTAVVNGANLTAGDGPLEFEAKPGLFLPAIAWSIDGGEAAGTSIRVDYQVGA